MSKTTSAKYKGAWLPGVSGLVVAAGMLTACGEGGEGDASSAPPSYTVGGTVSGLSGAGLVLANNGANSLSVSSAGPFTFTTALAGGATYAVTIQAQPAGQVCTVARGTGTVGAANVTDVAVSCVTTYSVGGSVSGLSGTGLVLANNAADNLPVSANGTFTFTTALPDGAAYAVSVSAQPVGQICAVANGAGHVASTNVTNVQVTCATAPLTLLTASPVNGATNVARTAALALTFSAPLNSSTVTAGNVTLQSTAGDQAISASANGSTLAVTPAQKLLPLTTYTLTVGTGLRGINGEQLASAVATGFTTRDRAWQGQELREPNAVGSATFSKVGFDANGNAIALWGQDDGTAERLWSNRYTPSGGWGTAVLLATYTGGDPARRTIRYSLAVDRSGNAIAVWSVFDGVRENAWSSRYTANGSWGTAEAIETGGGDTNGTPAIAMDADGNAIAVWHQFDGVGLSIWANRYTANVGWGTAVLIETNNTGAAGIPSIAVNANGDAVAVWNQTDGMGLSIWSNRYTADVGWGTAEVIETGTGNADSPAVAMDAGGNAIAVWNQTDGTRTNIWSNRYTANVGWGTAVLIENDNAGAANAASIAMDANGNGVAVWHQSDGARTNIWSNRYTANAGWGAAVLIENENFGDASLSASVFQIPVIAMDGSGNAVVVWYQFDGNRNDIWSNRYTANVGWGTAALIENDNSGNAVFPAIAVQTGGDALAMWVAFDGTRYRLYSARFE